MITIFIVLVLTKIGKITKIKIVKESDMLFDELNKIKRIENNPVAILISFVSTNTFKR